MGRRWPVGILFLVGFSMAALGVYPVFAQTPSPELGDLASLDQGRALYLQNCASCHGNYEASAFGNIIGASLLDNAFVAAQSDADLIAFLRVGRPADHPDNRSKITMPALGGNPALTQTDLENLVVYLRALTSANLPALVGDVPPPVLAGAGYTWELVAENFDSPLGLTHAGDGTGRLFILEQTGGVLVLQPDGTFSPFLDLTTLVPESVYHGGYTEQGLLGLAFAPDYAESGLFFVSYINRAGQTEIARYQVQADDPNRADPISAHIVLNVPQPYPDHNGGHIVFGPDGYLYLGLGDGGRPSEPNYFSQQPDLLLGKMLRLDVSRLPYRVPSDNPFVDDPRFAPEIWALGLRNPWKFSFDRATGDLYIADVGQWRFEEVNVQPATSKGGENYGWSVFEAFEPYLADAVAFSPLTPPSFAYSHEFGCSITGGYVYRGERLPELVGAYFYGDYCNGNIWLARRNAAGAWETSLFMETDFVISSFGEDEAGELYLVDYKGALYRLVGADD